MPVGRGDVELAAGESEDEVILDGGRRSSAGSGGPTDVIIIDVFIISQGERGTTYGCPHPDREEERDGYPEGGRRQAGPAP